MGRTGDSNPTLPDLCADVLFHALRLRRLDAPPDHHKLRAETLAVLKRFEGRARDAVIPPDAVEHVRFALVAFLDEIVMTSKWPVRDQWAIEPLQLTLFNTAIAGEQFFERVVDVDKSTSPRKFEVLEVYATCLFLGFRGKYGAQAGAGIERLQSELGELVRRLQSHADAGGPLSPHGGRQDPLRTSLRRWPAWIWMLGTAALVLMVFLCSQWFLAQQYRGLDSDLKVILGG